MPTVFHIKAYRKEECTVIAKPVKCLKDRSLEAATETEALYIHVHTYMYFCSQMQITAVQLCVSLSQAYRGYSVRDVGYHRKTYTSTLQALCTADRTVGLGHESNPPVLNTQECIRLPVSTHTLHTHFVAAKR
jgi:hypothetical protein